jgi:hypothetical protein
MAGSPMAKKNDIQKSKTTLQLMDRKQDRKEHLLLISPHKDTTQ